MVKVYDIGTFRMGARGGHFAIVVLSALGRLTMVVSSTIPAWDASVNNCGVVQDDRREPPRIEGHRPGPLGILSGPPGGEWSRFCRTRRPGRVFCRGARIRRAGCSRDRRPAGDCGIDDQLLGSGRRRFTIHKVWPAAEKAYPREGPVDLGCSEAPSRGLSSP